VNTWRRSSGGRIDRSRPISFSFNGRDCLGYQGDTLASALIANGVRLVGRSFKYHRPRGIFGSGAEEPNALVQIGEGNRTVPNLKATQVDLVEGLTARTINGWPNLRFDLYGISDRLSGLLPAGFYYKTFMWPRGLWPRYEHHIRQAAGLGRAPVGTDPDHYDKRDTHCDVLVAGAGPAGLMAAFSAARSGARVIIADEQSEFGGRLLSTNLSVSGQSVSDWLGDLVAALSAMPEVRLLPRSTVTGYHDHNFLVINERRTDHLAHPDPRVSRERLWRVRAGQVVLATGSIERGLVFEDNDRPGVMLASAVQTYLNRYAALPGRRGAVLTNNDSAYEVALDMHAAGIEVTGLVDIRQQPDESLLDRARDAGIPVYPGHAVCGVRGGVGGLTDIELCRLTGSGNDVLAYKGGVPCQVLAMSGGWNPTVHLHCQSGGEVRFDEKQGCFVPGDSVQQARSAGSARGTYTLQDCLAEGVEAGQNAVSALGMTPFAIDVPFTETREGTAIETCWELPDGLPEGRAGKKFVDYQNDTLASDIRLAAREGYRSIEHVKRYTALGFGTDQGKTGNINGVAILAEELGQSIPQTGTTTFRPNYTPVTFGAVAGRSIGSELFDPVRRTAMHEWHKKSGARFEDVGQWKRPWYYPLEGEDMTSAVARECLATRQAVGVFDASTLGKIDIQGPDAAEFLNRVYTNNWSKLGVGRCRYGLMLGEDGMVMDDGVTARLGEQHYLMTTTTGGAAHVLGWLERWQQTEWPELKVYFTSVTDRWAVISMAGPRSRALLESLCEDIDLSAEAFPFMSWRQGTVAGVDARVFRISFSGELAFEVNVCADFGAHLWSTIMEAGREQGATPYGTEAMHILRAEKGYIIVGQDTDGSVTPADLGMDWIVSKDKDFIGKRSLYRSDTIRENRKQLVGLLTDDPEVQLPEGAQLVNEPSIDYPVPMVGHVTSSYQSATLDHSIALALVKGGRSRKGGIVYAQLMDGRVIPATIAEPVFYDPENSIQKS